MPQTYEIIGGDHRPHGPVTGEELCQWIREGAPATKPWCASAGRKLGSPSERSRNSSAHCRACRGCPSINPTQDSSAGRHQFGLGHCGAPILSGRRSIWRAGRVLRTPGAFANCPVRWRIGRHRTSHCRVGFRLYRHPHWGSYVDSLCYVMADAYSVTCSCA